MLILKEFIPVFFFTSIFPGCIPCKLHAGDTQTASFRYANGQQRIAQYKKMRYVKSHIPIYMILKSTLRVVVL